MTPQQIFDHIVSHVRGMKSRAGFWTNDSFLCSYLDDENRMCAVGSLFPLLNLPKEVMAEMQMFSGCASDLSRNFEDYLPKWFTSNNRLLKDLQVIHDCSEHWNKNGFNEYGENYLKMTASHYGLVYTPK